MLPRNKQILTSCLCAVLAGGLGAADTPGQSTPVIRVDTRLVVLHATVVDKNGHLVLNLPETAFSVFENGVQQHIKVFKREDVPVSMGLVIDNSGSMREKRAKVEAAALALVKDSNPQDEVFIVNFNDEAFLDKDFTNDPKELQEGLARIDSRGGTAMRDAIRMSIDHLKEKAKKDKKVLVVVTDGNDNSSLISLESLVKAAQDSGVLVYTVGLLNDEEKKEARRCKRALQELASVTGGEAYFPKELSEVDHVAHQVARDIRNQYILAYTPENLALDGSFRQIRVTANGPGRPTVRTRSGYYATPDGIGGNTTARNNGSN
ncbi:MAG TPA: VWA domain-containing protein [Bryobacteraceae bacterium]|nr:VWA domain-containing protein [Bryobacteraceae bacterium]